MKFGFIVSVILTLLASCTGSCASASTHPAQRLAAFEGNWTALVGNNNGLFGIDQAGKLTELWTEGSVRKIVSVEQGVWAILGNEGVLISNDLVTWEKRNGGLPVKTIKVFQDGRKSFLQIVQELKDLKVNPENPQVMVCSTKDRIYLSRNQGRSWVNLGLPTPRTNGTKTVASAYMPGATAAGELTVFMSSCVYGVYYIHPDRPNAQWTELSRGLERLESTNNADEVADILVRPSTDIYGNKKIDVFVSQTFRRRIYQLDWSRKTFNHIWRDASPFGTVDSLSPGENDFYFLYEGTVASLSYENFTKQKQQGVQDAIASISEQIMPNSVVILEDRTRSDSKLLVLNELWLLAEPEPSITERKSTTIPNARSPFPAHAIDKEGIYLPVNHAMDSSTLRRYLNHIDRAGLNMVVIDMKDDYGRLRFSPRNPAITAKGRVFNPLDIDQFLSDMKERGIYTVARIVVFKDRELAARENGRYAVWDRRNNKPWVGYYDRRQRSEDITEADRNNSFIQIFPSDDPEFEIVRRTYDERWVDPYSEEVWEYNTAVSVELYERGFDEIQFDYIRFPTDGDNLADAGYRWFDTGMDMESAMLSFLRHARARINAPISIDIYGANGWYRTGARTGQEVELLAPYVDVICPMYYPSHFEQHFLAHNPPELRPWRIIYQGTLRTSRIARGQVIVRSWVQAFFLNVSYDRQYYDEVYVRRQTEGARQAGNGGLTYWNQGGRYDDVPNRVE